MIDGVKFADYEAFTQGKRTWTEYRRKQAPGWRPDLRGADLTSVKPRGVKLDANLRDANLRDVNLRDVNLTSADLTSANLTSANLTGANLDGANITSANLTRADLTSADLTSAKLTSAKLSRAKLSRAKLRWAKLGGADLIRANLGGANLTGANLRGANLGGADLTSANLTSADLTSADLTSAKLTSANLRGANLRGANLGGADLTSADLTSADLTSADLTSADLTSAKLGETVLADVDMSALCGAEGIMHRGPSPVDVRSVIRSHTHPRIQRFLMECGVPWIFAEYMIDCAKAVTDQDVRALMQSTFISYGQPDDPFARKLYESLISRKLTVFYFPETARWGERLSNEVHRQLNSHDRVILICSKDSLDRPGVLNEIQETFDREARDGGADYLLPIALDDYLFDPNGLEKVQPALAHRIRARIVGDFRNWQSSTTEYDKALNRLIDALKKFRP